MSLLPVEMPEIGKPVSAVIKACHSWAFTFEVTLIAVDESDCSWRFVEDGCQFSNDWDVVYWEYNA